MKRVTEKDIKITYQLAEGVTKEQSEEATRKVYEVLFSEVLKRRKEKEGK